MLSYAGFDEVIKNVRDNGNEHVFKFWDLLDSPEKKSLLEQLKRVNFREMNELFGLTRKPPEIALDYAPAPYVKIPIDEKGKNTFKSAENTGLEIIKKGKVCAFVVAGGQGSRLGFEGPKGVYRVSSVKNKSLFQLHCEKIKKYSLKYKVSIPFLIMTSDVNHDDTVKFLSENNFFGLDKNDVFMFPQNMIPSMDAYGKLILADRSKIFTNPDGHGGSLTVLRTSGMLDVLRERGIEYISYFQIDNPTLKIVDPVFVGFHHLNCADISSKAVRKAYPDEKVGNFVKFTDGKFGIIEYSDLPKEKIFQKSADGEYSYSAGSIAIHIFSRSFVEEITSGGSLSLPFHVAKKKIPSFTENGIVEIDGYKFEKFVFDALPLTEKNFILETTREDEFAPVKNKSGVDSVDTSRELMTGLYRKWLFERGISIPSKVKNIEISPLLAVEAEDIPKDLKVPDEESVYLE